MDVAALNLNIDSTSVLKAANDLDTFSAAAKRAGAASGLQSGSIAKLVASVQSMDAKLTSIVGSLDKIARASRAAAAANDDMAGAATKAASAMANADSHVVAYAQHLSSGAAAQRDFNAHLVTYQAHLQSLPSRQAQSNSHVEAYRKQIETIPPALTKVTKASNDNAAAMTANASNIAAQFQDIGVTAAMGMNPALIALQQGTQLGAAFQGGLGSLKAAFIQLINPMSLFAIALAAALALLIQWAIEAAQAADDTGKLQKAIDDTKLTTYAFGDAQNALSTVMDITTGKITTQSQALWGLARAQLEVIRAQALADQSESRKALMEARGENERVSNTRRGITIRGADKGANSVQQLYDSFLAGRVTSSGMIDNLQRMREAGSLTEETFIKLTGAVANFGVAGENLKVYDEAMKALGGDQSALKQFLDPKKAPRERKQFGFSDLTDDAAAMTRELMKARAEIGLYGEDLARVSYEQELLNKAADKGLALSPAQRAAIAATAAELAKLAEANRLATFREETKQAALQEFAALKDVAAQIGIYGRDLTALRYEQEMLNKAVAEHITLTDKDRKKIAEAAGMLADKDYANVREQSRSDNARWHAEQMRQLDVERDAIGLTGEALIAYNYQQQLINKALEAGVTFKDIDFEKTQRQAEAYAQLRSSVDRQAQALADSREVTKGFFADAINGAREGANAFKALGDAAINALNRIIDKLLDKTLDTFLNGIFSGGSGGGLLGSIFGGSSGTTTLSSGLVAPKDMSPWEIAASGQKFARGGAFGTPIRFAKGGTFTNSIINTPTLFRFANGSQFGEMGEAGPEAVMPLSRDSKGRLGVHVAGGGGASSGPPQVGVSIQQDFYLTGTMSQKDVENMSRAAAQQGAESAVNTVRRNFDTYLREWDTDGAVST